MSEEIVRNKEAEAKAIARRMSENYRTNLEYHREYNQKTRKLTPREAAEQAEFKADERLNPSDEHAKRIHKKPLEEIDWFDLETLELNEEGKGWEKWEQIMALGREELESGVYGEEAIIPRSAHPMRRARYIALRNRLMQQWQPRDMIEETLIEQLAQQYTLYLQWMSVSSARSWGEMRELTKWEQVYEAPRVSEQEADEHALIMTERSNRLFLRTLRALRDMRRYAPVIIANAGQVNVAGQQVNIAEIEGKPE